MAEHRLYGVVDAADAWSVGKWSRAVLEQLSELRHQDRPAILIGGTGLYFMALTRGLADIPPVPSSVRDTSKRNICMTARRRFANGLPRSTRHRRARSNRATASGWCGP